MTAKQDKARCDVLASAIVRRTGQCEYCGIVLGFKGLHCSHYVGRTAAWTRTYGPNLVSSCPADHRRHTNQPGLHYRQFVELRGVDVEQECHRRANDGIGTKFDWGEERERLEALAAELISDPDTDADAEAKLRSLVPKRLQSSHPSKGER